MNEKTGFLFACKGSFFTHFWTKSIEWMKMLCFFSREGKKTQIWNRMNEWHVNFYRKKKHLKIWRKKKHTPLSRKKKKNPLDPEWMAHELFPGKKKYTPVFFFSALFRDKKKVRIPLGWHYPRTPQNQMRNYISITKPNTSWISKVYSKEMWQ